MPLVVVAVLAALVTITVHDAGDRSASRGMERSRSAPPMVRELWAALDGAGQIDEPAAPRHEVAADVPRAVVTATATESASTVPPPAGPVVNEPPPGPDRSAPAPPPGPPPSPAESTAVHPENFPDPFVVRSHGVYWAFSTQVGLTEVPTLRSMDLVNWEWVGDALQDVPAWAESGHNWAPAVLERGSRFVLYYTTRHRATGLQCISRAASVLAQGPYLDDSTAPLICQTDRGGSIDPSPFVDADGRAWLLWKSEGTLQGEPTRIWVQPLSADGLRLVEAPTQLLERRLAWEFPIIEGPSMTLVDGRHHLFYSGNRWETADYAVGHAVCESVTGPCHRTSSRPVLATRAAEVGPGGQEVVRAPSGELVLVHHTWGSGAAGYANGGARLLHISSLHFDGDRVTVGGPWGRRSGGSLVDGLGPSGTRGGSSDRPPMRRLG